MTISKQQPRGIALMIVLVTVAVATVLAFALIGSQATLAQASSNGLKAMQADALAESGLQLAAYYLQNPSEAPVLNSAGFYPGQTGVSLGADAPGTVDITVTEVTPGTYDILCTANSGATSSLRRTVGARAQMEYAYIATDAMSIAGPTTVLGNMTINGSLKSSGTVTVAIGGKVNGTIYAPSILGSLLNVVGTLIGAVTNIEQAAPMTIKDYKKYRYKGKEYHAQEIAVAPQALNPTTNNPMGVYYTSGDLEALDDMTVQGTLIVGGEFKVSTNHVVITPMPGMPALIVYKQLKVKGSNRNLTTNGLTWIKEGITKDGLISLNNKIIVNGALLFPTSAGVNSGLGGTITVNYDALKATAREFLTDQSDTPYSVRLTSFQTASSN